MISGAARSGDAGADRNATTRHPPIRPHRHLSPPGISSKTPSAPRRRSLMPIFQIVPALINLQQRTEVLALLIQGRPARSPASRAHGRSVAAGVAGVAAVGPVRWALVVQLVPIPRQTPDLMLLVT
jgi:hypothetical protein